MSNSHHRLQDFISNLILGNSNSIQNYLKNHLPELSILLDLQKSTKNISRISHQSKKDDCLDENSLSGYHDGLLSPADKKKVENHIKTCDACALELLFLYSMDEKNQKVFKKKIKKFSPLKSPLPFLVLKMTKNGFNIISSTLDLTSVSPEPILVRSDIDDILSIKKSSFQAQIKDMILDIKLMHIDRKNIKISIFFNNLGDDILATLYKKTKLLQEKKIENDYVSFILEKGFYKIEILMKKTVFFLNIQIK